MSLSHNNDGDRPLSDPGDSGGPINEPKSARLAHELTNLLDAGMRNVGLVMSRLRDAHQVPESGDDDLVLRLETVSDAMQQMAHLVQGWIGSAPHRFDTEQTLGKTVRQLVRLFEPVAGHHDIEISSELSDEVAQVPAGPVYSILANALRNSIEAIQGDSKRQGHGVIRFTGQVENGHVNLQILDSGPGVDATLVHSDGCFRFGLSTKPGGHGIGLALAHQICVGLGGMLDIRNAAEGGTILTVRYPRAAVDKRPGNK